MFREGSVLNWNVTPMFWLGMFTDIHTPYYFAYYLLDSVILSKTRFWHIRPDYIILLYWWCYYAYVDTMSMMWWCYHSYEILLWLCDFDVVIIMRFPSFIMTMCVYLLSLMKYDIYDVVRGYQPMMWSI